MKTLALFAFGACMVACALAYHKNLTMDAIMFACEACAMLLARITIQLDEAKK